MSADTTTESTEAVAVENTTPEAATPVEAQTETAPEAPAVEAAPESAPVEVATAPAPAGEQLPTVADFLAPIGGGKGEASISADKIKLSFSRKGGDMTFSLEADSVTVSGKRV